jgi:hypothetical protein
MQAPQGELNMKIKIEVEVEVELRDWNKARKLSLKEHLGEITETKMPGVKFNISRSLGGLSFMVDQEGTHREAIADCSGLVKAMAEALTKHGKKIDAEKAA